jgi:AcrR family transcriptional regulator
MVIDHPYGVVLWGREITHLPSNVQHRLRGELLAAIKPVRAAIAAMRPDLDDDAVDLVLWATAGVMASVGYHSATLERGRFVALLTRTCQSVCAVTELPQPDRDERQRSSASANSQLPASRQEAILVSATRLFGKRGYQAVSVDDIGAATGITGAAVYHHYPNKSAILTAAVTRSLQAMFFDLSSALSAPSPGEALDQLLGRLARMSVEHDGTIGALLMEIPSLPPEERAPLRQAELDYAAEWIALLSRHRPALAEAEAQVLVWATISVINALLNTPHLRSRPTLGAELVAFGRAILATDAGPATPR